MTTNIANHFDSLRPAAIRAANLMVLKERMLGHFRLSDDLLSVAFPAVGKPVVEYELERSRWRLTGEHAWRDGTASEFVDFCEGVAAGGGQIEDSSRVLAEA
jgi:hypothetical protein